MRDFPSDKELLDWLQEQNDKALHGGRCVFRWSLSGRGWRLHETLAEQASSNVREAIARAMWYAND